MSLHQDLRKAEIRAELLLVRGRTLALLHRVPDDFLKVRVHDFYSPVGWHFGHVGMTEEFWACAQAMKQTPLDDALTFLFANLPENPKDARVHLPSRQEIIAYLEETRERVLQALDEADLAVSDPLLTDGYAWEFAISHEYQHQETITELLQLIHQARGPKPIPQDDVVWREPKATEMAAIPGGTFVMGTNDLHAYDNEKRAHEVTVAPFQIDKTPVSCAQWLQFIEDGGYERPGLWTEAGWAWRQGEGADRPEYWLPLRDGMGCGYYGPEGVRALHPHEPVSSLSWFEASAYAKWAWKRLPTEAEWEYAAGFDPATGRMRRYPWGDTLLARHNPNAFRLQGIGGVWEWTSSPFLPYPGFEPFPYDGYSKDHMDGAHYVCRGGSWATADRIRRCTFRNWYVPTYRQGLLGLRCAKDSGR